MGARRKGGRAQQLAPVGDARSGTRTARGGTVRLLAHRRHFHAGLAGERREGDSRPDGLTRFSAPRHKARAPAAFEPQQGTDAPPSLCLPGPGSVGSAARFYSRTSGAPRRSLSLQRCPRTPGAPHDFGLFTFGVARHFTNGARDAFVFS